MQGHADATAAIGMLYRDGRVGMLSDATAAIGEVNGERKYKPDLLRALSFYERAVALHGSSPSVEEDLHKLKTRLGVVSGDEDPFDTIR